MLWDGKEERVSVDVDPCVKLAIDFGCHGREGLYETVNRKGFINWVVQTYDEIPRSILRKLCGSRQVPAYPALLESEEQHDNPRGRVAAYEQDTKYQSVLTSSKREEFRGVAKNMLNKYEVNASQMRENLTHRFEYFKHATIFPLMAYLIESTPNIMSMAALTAGGQQGIVQPKAIFHVSSTLGQSYGTWAQAWMNDQETYYNTMAYVMYNLVRLAGITQDVQSRVDIKAAMNAPLN